MPETRPADVTRSPRGTVKAAPLAEVAAGWERPLGSDPRDPVPTVDTTEYAAEDVLVEVPGTDSAVFVAAGDPIPTVTDPAPPPARSAAARRRKPPKA